MRNFWGFKSDGGVCGIRCYFEIMFMGWCFRFGIGGILEGLWEEKIKNKLFYCVFVFFIIVLDKE